MSTTTESQINTGTKLYARARQLMPVGVQLFSKLPSGILPEQWPTYYDRAQGCHVWDLDGRQYIDMMQTSIGATLLGANDPDVSAAVIQTVQKGAMCSLNAPEEVELAQVLVDMHPWADMVRYARTGGESMAVAVRIARAFTGKDIVAVCGYHGWSDWYIAVNRSQDDGLDELLLPGISPSGVPKALAGTALPYRYNRIEELEAIAREHGDELGAITLEPIRHDEPTDGFLDKVRQIADRTGAVLIVDEITAGFRMTFGGSHQLYGLEPDIAVYAKSISNGHPMGAIVGKRDIMMAAERSFISSLYWTDRVGPVAALATIAKLKRCNVAEHVNRIGRRAQEIWRQAADRNQLKLKIFGPPSLVGLAFDYGDKSAAVTTLYTQEMLDRGYLAAPSFYPTYAHTDAVLDAFVPVVDEVFAALADAVGKDQVMSRLRGPVKTALFGRLT